MPSSYLIEKETLSIPVESLIDLMLCVHRKGAAFRFRAEGLSMAPFIRDGDIITVSPPGTARANIGDVVACAHPVTGKLIVHRIIAIKDSCFAVRGDNLNLSDGLIHASRIFGVVTKVERQNKPVYFGEGFEKRILAMLSGRSLLRKFTKSLSEAKRALKNLYSRK